MISKRIATACLMASVALTPAGRASADGDALVGGIVGGIIGGVIVNEANKNRRQQTTRVYRAPRASTMSTAERESNREVQVALNYFGFPVGSADGVLGRNSRAAISNYQSTLGYAPTGQLTEYERNFLVGSYQRAMAGGAVTAQQVATNPMGVRGLLITYRDEALGIAPQAPAAAAVAATAALPEVAAPAPAPALPVIEATTAPAGEPGLPTFLGGDITQASLASHCNKVSLLTNSNGGFVTAATMTDATFALNEQFCLARTYAIAQGEEMVAKVQGFTPQQIAQQCEGFGPAMKDQIAAVSLKPRDEVVQAVSGFVLSTGMAPAQLVGTAKICLSVGYRTDNMDVALGSALLLTALGDKVYSELIGHHLAQGFGTSQRPDLALSWYDMGLEALAAGSPAVFVPGQPDRADLIRKAAYVLGGRAEAEPEGAAVLPTFALAPVPEVPVETAEPAATAAADATLNTRPAAPEETAGVAPATPAGADRSVGNALGFVANLPFTLLNN